MSKSNHELAKKYESKSGLIGSSRFKLRYLEDDKVILMDVLDKDDTGLLVIPSFITDISYGALKGCKYREIYIDNSNSLKFDASGVCSGLMSVRLKVSFKYPERVVDTNNMFYGCINLARLDVSSLDTSNILDMGSMFDGCKSLQILDISNFDTSKVVNMKRMFNGCKSLRALDVSKWETHRLRIVGDIFYNCKSLKSIDMSSWDISSVNSINNMFSGCDKLEYIVLGKVMGRDRVSTMESVFKGCKMLKEVDFSGFKNIYIGILKDIFNGCESIEEIDLSWIESSDSYISRDSMFKGCNKLKLVKVNTKSKLTIGRVLIFDDIDCEIEYYE